MGLRWFCGVCGALDVFIPTCVASAAVSFTVPVTVGVEYRTVYNYSSVVEPLLWWLIMSDVECILNALWYVSKDLRDHLVP